MPFIPEEPAARERRRVVVNTTPDGKFTVDARRTFLKVSDGTSDYVLNLTGAADSLDEAMQAAQGFMRTGVF
jgi:hypothetical protein